MATFDKETVRLHEIVALLKGWKVLEEEFIKPLKIEVEIKKAKLESKPIKVEHLAELNDFRTKLEIVSRLKFLREGLEEEINSPARA